MTRKFKHINFTEREIIKRLLSEKTGISEIARILNRAKSSISQEIRRNLYNKYYLPHIADSMARKRKKQSRRQRKMNCPEINSFVRDGLKKQWSPEQISGRMRLEYPDAQSICISHESIYQWLWRDKRLGGDWHKELRQFSRKRRKQRNSRDSRGIIKNRVSIDKRPQSVLERRFFGDWEGDTLQGKHGHGFIASVVERKTSYACFALMPDKTPGSLNRAVIRRFRTNPALPKRTLTLDNGREFSWHKELSESLKTRIFFCHPYHSWERGLNENTNGLLRQYFPKGADFLKIDDESLAKVEELLNNRPRKKLNYRTPAEAMNAYLKRKETVRIRC